MNSGRLAARAFVRNVVARRNYGGGKHHRATTMNDMPTPQGDFFMHQAGIQRTHNAILALGVIMFSSTIYITYQSKLINLNYSPPDTYE